MNVGYFPFSPGGNPYQNLFAGALESAGLTVTRIPPKKWFPIRSAVSVGTDLLQFDWPHDWYNGRNGVSRTIKSLMYRDGLRLLKDRPLVWTAHNLYTHGAEDLDYDKRMMQRLIDRCDGIIVLSESAEKQMRETYRLSAGTEVSVIRHGHYMDVYPSGVTRAQAREQLAISADERVALFVGRILPYKGLETLIDAFSEAGVSGSTLMIAGSCADESYRKVLTDLAASRSSENVSIQIDARFIPDDQLQTYYAASDVVALPFKNILNSGSLLLAMSFGKCVVAPDRGSIREVAFPDGWFPYTQDAELGAALRQALLSDDLVEREARVVDFTSTNYSWQKIGQQANALYDSIS